MPERVKLWQRLAAAWKPEQVLHEAIKVYRLEQLEEAFGTVLSGKALGRQLVSLQSR
ncbi:hypothetical protein D3C77_816260 [compost metagenome]